MKKTYYEVESVDGQTCGHKHKTHYAAWRCWLRKGGTVNWYNAKILKNGRCKDGIGLYPDEH